MRSKLNNWSVYRESSSSGCGRVNYVDPWDLENYAYLRRHASIAATQPIYQRTAIAGCNAYSSSCSSSSSRSAGESADYWYTPSLAIREPGYDAPASLEEIIYFRPQQQQIYEDEVSHYAAPIPLYTRLSELEHEKLRTREMIRRHRKLTASSRNYLSREECCYQMLMEAPSRNDLLLDDFEAEAHRHPIRCSNNTSYIRLNTYGHLKIDYTNSWNSLHRKIVSK